MEPSITANCILHQMWPSLLSSLLLLTADIVIFSTEEVAEVQHFPEEEISNVKILRTHSAGTPEVTTAAMSVNVNLIAIEFMWCTFDTLDTFIVRYPTSHTSL